MDGFDTNLAFTNMPTKFLRNFKFKFFKKLSVKCTRTLNSFYDFYMFLCLSTYDTPLMLATSVLCILAKFCDFLKPVTVL